MVADPLRPGVERTDFSGTAVALSPRVADVVVDGNGAGGAVAFRVGVRFGLGVVTVVRVVATAVLPAVLGIKYIARRLLPPSLLPATSLPSSSQSL